MPKVVKSHALNTSLRAQRTKRSSRRVGSPRNRTVRRVREHECLPTHRCSDGPRLGVLELKVAPQDCSGPSIDRYSASLIRLRALFDQLSHREYDASLDVHNTALHIDVTSTQGEELSSPRPSGGSKHHECRELWIRRLGEPEELDHLCRSWGRERAMRNLWWGCVECRIVRDPAPPDSLRECSPDDAVNPLNCPWGIWTLRSTDLQQLAVEAIEILRGQLCSVDSSQCWKDRTVEIPAGRGNRLRGEAWGRVSQPLLEELLQGALLHGALGRTTGDLRRKRRQGLGSFSLPSPERSLDVALAAGEGISADVDAQLPGVLPSLSHRAGHRAHR